MKNILVTLIMTGSVFASCAQSKCPVKKAYAFYTVSYPGVQMADENGNPVPPVAKTNRIIYIEWRGAKKPEIETVLYNKEILTATMEAIEGTTVIPGDDTGNNKNYKITAQKNNSLWKMQLQTVAGKQMPSTNCKNIVIRIPGTEKICEFKLVKETQLMTLPRY